MAGRRFRSLPDKVRTKRALPDTCEPTAHIYWYPLKTRGCICVVLREIQTEIPFSLNMLHKLLSTVVVSLLYASLQTSQPKYKITFTFDYDFRVTPACSQEVKQACVQQFNFYEISRGIPKRAKLGSIPVPANAKGFVKGISGTTEAFLFDHGRHMVAVAAQMPNGSESDLRKCATIVKIP